MLGLGGTLSKISDVVTPVMPGPNLCVCPGQVWHKEGKGGVAFEAPLLVVEETRQRPAVNDCFGENDL